MHLPHPQPGLSPGACPYPSPHCQDRLAGSWLTALKAPAERTEVEVGKGVGGSVPRSACGGSSRGPRGSTSPSPRLPTFCRGPTGDTEGRRGCHLHGCPTPTPFCPQREGLLCSASEVTSPVPWGMHPAGVGGPRRACDLAGQGCWGRGEEGPFPGGSASSTWALPLPHPQTSPGKASGEGNFSHSLPRECGGPGI